MSDEESQISAADMARYGGRLIQDLLAIEDLAEQTRAIRAWIFAGEQGLVEGAVKLVTSDGQPLATDFVNAAGKRRVVDHQGWRCPRRVAFDQMLKYGPGGIYVGKDQRTGMSEVDWIAFKTRNPDMANLYYRGKEGPTFISNHLLQVRDDEEAA